MRDLFIAKDIRAASADHFQEHRIPRCSATALVYITDPAQPCCSHVHVLGWCIRRRMEAPVVVNKEAARSVAHRPLPPVPPEAVGKTSLLLFYQYVEPQWTGKEHKHALKTVIALGERRSGLGP